MTGGRVLDYSRSVMLNPGPRNSIVYTTMHDVTTRKMRFNIAWMIAEATEKEKEK
jgi:hypothetical protein